VSNAHQPGTGQAVLLRRPLPGAWIEPDRLVDPAGCPSDDRSVDRSL